MPETYRSAFKADLQRQHRPKDAQENAEEHDTLCKTAILQYPY